LQAVQLFNALILMQLQMIAAKHVNDHFSM